MQKIKIGDCIIYAERKLTRDEVIELFETLYGQLYKTENGRYYYIDEDYIAHYASWDFIRSEAYRLFELNKDYDEE